MQSVISSKMFPRPGFSGVAMFFFFGWLAVTFFCKTKIKNNLKKNIKRIAHILDVQSIDSPTPNTVSAGNRTYVPVHFLPSTPAPWGGNVY